MPFSSSCHLLFVHALKRKWSSRARPTWTGSPKGEAGAQPNQLMKSVRGSVHSRITG
jgi:hypothetical protein